MRALFALAGLLALCGAAEAGQTFPNWFITPGFTNPDVTQGNIKRTICRAGWTKTIRPPTSYTNTLKRQQIAAYGYADKRMRSYEEDHLISLQLGGHPRDPRNLWPEAYVGACGARRKDVIETKLKRLVCSGKITLAQAQEAIAWNWVAAYNQYVKPLNCP
jgi:hypothetical protein